MTIAMTRHVAGASAEHNPVLVVHDVPYSASPLLRR